VHHQTVFRLPFLTFSATGSSIAIALLVLHHQSITCERVGIPTNAHRIMTL
jgi:hypothetical protein